MPRSIRGSFVLALAALAAPLLVVGAQPAPAPEVRDSAVFQKRSPDACVDCGTVRSVREVSRPGGSNTSTITHATAIPSSSFDTRLVGPVMVLPFGGSSKGTYVGGAGTPEWNARFGESTYEIIVRMDDGSYRTVERRDGASYAIDDRVRIAQGRLELLPQPAPR